MTLNKQEDFEPKPPNYANNQFGVAIWKNRDKNGNEFLSVHIPLLEIKVPCFPTGK